jgi:N-acetyl-D-muramate 6-phosphate phosphatase
MVKAVLFDLDGTLADTAPDLGHAINVMRAARNLAPVPLEKTRPVTSSGARGLLAAGFEMTPEHRDYAAMKTEFLNIYEQNVCRETQLFPGMAELLAALEQRGTLWGVVTNKAERFTHPLLRGLGLHERAACIVGGDSTPHLKPHPASLLLASELLALPPSNCLYVGDDERDMLAGRAAGMPVAAAVYGYLGHGKPAQEWDADLWINDPREILNFIEH